MIPVPAASPSRPSVRLTPFAAPAMTRKSRDRKSTRLNSSHLVISYAVFCLKKKKNTHLSRGLHEHRREGPGALPLHRLHAKARSARRRTSMLQLSLLPAVTNSHLFPAYPRL